MRFLIPAAIGAVVCIFLLGCTATSENGSSAVLGAGYVTSGKSSVQVSEKVAQAISDASNALSVGKQASDLAGSLAKELTAVTEESFR